MRRRHRKWWRLIALAVTFALAAACGGDDTDATSSEGGSGPDDTVDQGTTDRQPVDGGTLVVGIYSEVASLDPILGANAGSVGAIEQTALYDLLVRYDYDTGEYVGQTAESIEPNDDFSEWTLVLRSGITFTDGTAYDAEAVKINAERHMAESSNSTVKGIMIDTIESIDVVDELTVRFALKDPWAGFPVLLTVGPGRLVSPTAIQSQGEGVVTNPVGAGPFVLDSFKPGEALVLRRNVDYWAGAPHLDTLRFVSFGTPALTKEALERGELQMAFLQDPIVASEAMDEGIAGFETEIGSIISLVMNGSEESGAATADPRVREAIVAAIDVETVNQRAFEGAATTAGSPFPPSLVPDQTPPKPDPDRARQLVDEVRGEGWDGKIRLLVQTNPSGSAYGQAVEAMLEAVGMDVTVEQLAVPALVNRVLVNKDYELAQWGLTMTPDDLLYSNLAQNLAGRYGVVTPEMTAALGALRVAGTTQARDEAIEAIADAWASYNPIATIAHYSAYVAWADSVQDVKTSTAMTVLLDDAWIDR